MSRYQRPTWKWPRVHKSSSVSSISFTSTALFSIFIRFSSSSVLFSSIITKPISLSLSLLPVSQQWFPSLFHYLYPFLFFLALFPLPLSLISNFSLSVSHQSAVASLDFTLVIHLHFFLTLFPTSLLFSTSHNFQIIKLSTSTREYWLSFFHICLHQNPVSTLFSLLTKSLSDIFPISALLSSQLVSCSIILPRRHTHVLGSTVQLHRQVNSSIEKSIHILIIH